MASGEIFEGRPIFLFMKGAGPRASLFVFEGEEYTQDSKDRLFFAGRDGGIHASAGGL